MLPYVTGLCPYFRAPALLANSLALWLQQDYPIERRCLIILDDDGTFDDQAGKGWELYSCPARLPSLPAKYNRLLDLSAKPQTDIYLVWEQDDTYLPKYTSAHVKALENAELSKPSKVLSDYTGVLDPEMAAGRFHSSLAFRRALIERIGGWPETQRADFDQQLISKLTAAANGIGDPWPGRFDPMYFVYGWNTGVPHGQSTMRSPDDSTWYARAEQAYPPVEYVGRLVPKMDQRTERIFAELRKSNWV